MIKPTSVPINIGIKPTSVPINIGIKPTSVPHLMDIYFLLSV